MSIKYTQLSFGFRQLGEAPCVEGEFGIWRRNHRCLRLSVAATARDTNPQETERCHDGDSSHNEKDEGGSLSLSGQLHHFENIVVVIVGGLLAVEPLDLVFVAIEIGNLTGLETSISVLVADGSSVCPILDRAMV